MGLPGELRAGCKPGWDKQAGKLQLLLKGSCSGRRQTGDSPELSGELPAGCKPGWDKQAGKLQLLLKGSCSGRRQTGDSPELSGDLRPAPPNPPESPGGFPPRLPHPTQ